MIDRFWLLAGALASLCCSSPAAAESSRPDRCLPDLLVRRSDIVMLGMYGGGGVPMPYMLPGSSKPANVVAVAGRMTRPTMLVLTAYEATVWDLSALAGQPITAVYASGFRTQGVTGLPLDVPVVLRHWSPGGASGSRADPCPDLRWSVRQYQAMSSAIDIRRAFGKWPTDFHGSYSPMSFVIGQARLPFYAAIPDPAAVRTEGIMTFGGPEMQRLYGPPARILPSVERESAEARRQAELDGRRLLHVRSDRRGNVVQVEPELFGADRWREQTSRD